MATIFGRYFRGGGQVSSRCLTVAASAISCDCFFVINSFVSHAMKVARVIAVFQQELKQEGKNLLIYFYSVSPGT